MNDGIFISNGNRHGNLMRLHAELIALAASKNITIVFEEQKQPAVQDMIEKLKLQMMPEIKEPFFPRETAYERRNRGQKWYCKFNRRKHK